MNIIQKKIRKLFVSILFSMVFCTEITVAPCNAAEETVGDVIIITPEEELHEPDEKPIQLKQPDDFQAEAAKNGIKLRWKETQDAQQYEIYRKISGKDESFSLIKTTKKCTYTDKTAKYGVTYAYKVRTIAVLGEKTKKSPCSQIKRCRTYFVDPSKPMIALTFDDGPSIYTDGILDVLEANQSRATFFVLGNRVNSYKKTVLRIGKLGCEIGNHSYDHAILGNNSVSKIRSEISKTDKKIKALTGNTPVLLRPPYGSIGNNLKKNAGKPMILWSVDTLDWKSRNASTVYQHVMSHAKDGDIILMHDLYFSTRAAAKRIIPELKKRGYQLVTVSELAYYRGIEWKAGERYAQMWPQKH